MNRLGIYALKLTMCEAVTAAHAKVPVQPPNHRSVAEAILSRDADSAERAMRQHLELSRAYGFLQWYRQSRLGIARTDAAIVGGKT